MRTARHLAVITFVGVVPLACDDTSSDNEAESTALSTAPSTPIAPGSDNGVPNTVPTGGAPGASASPPAVPSSTESPAPGSSPNLPPSSTSPSPDVTGAGGTTSGSGDRSGTAGADEMAFAGAGSGGTMVDGHGGAMDAGVPAAGVAGGMQGTPADWLSAAETLDGFAMLKPCVSSFQPSGNANNQGDCCCEEEAQNENQRVARTFGGDPDVTYHVTLRIAGVAERYWYAGGQTDVNSDLFYIGGLPTIHGAASNEGLAPGQGACKVHPPETDDQFALPFEVPVEVRPEDGCYNGFNIFALTVSAPKQSYYLNATEDFDGADRQPHSVYTTDYTVTIPIQGQAELTFYTIDGDHHQVTNNGTMTVADVTTPQPYNGNFLELTVVDVVPAP